MGEYDSVAVIVRRVLLGAPHDRFAGRHLMVALFARAHPEDRDELIQTMLMRANTAEDSANYSAFVGAFLESAGDPRRRAEAIEEAPPLSFDHVVVPVVYARLRAREETLDVLERMLRDHDVFLPETLRRPELEWLREDPRFEGVWREVFGPRP